MLLRFDEICKKNIQFVIEIRSIVRLFGNHKMRLQKIVNPIVELMAGELTEQSTK